MFCLKAPILALISFCQFVNNVDTIICLCFREVVKSIEGKSFHYVGLPRPFSLFFFFLSESSLRPKYIFITFPLICKLKRTIDFFHDQPPHSLVLFSIRWVLKVRGCYYYLHQSQNTFKNKQYNLGVKDFLERLLLLA